MGNDGLSAEPLDFSIGEDGTASVEVHVIARDLNGNVLFDEKAGHVFQIKDGLSGIVTTKYLKK